MNGPRINNDERGLTINKTLAWAILAFFIAQGGGAIWTVAQMSSRIAAVEQAAAENREAIRRDAQQIAILQRTEARMDERLQAISASVTRIEAAMAEIARYVRETGR